MKTVSVCFFLNTIAEGKCGRMVFRDRSLFVAWGGGGGGGGGGVGGAEEFREEFRDFKRAERGSALIDRH